MTLEAIRQEHTCSVCDGKFERLAVKSLKSGKVLCHNCLYDFQVKLGLVPDGALRCLRCGFYQFVNVRYAGNINVAFTYLGQDERDTAIYAAVHVNRLWDRRHAKYLAAHCGKCQSQIPFKRVWENPYILPRDQRMSPSTEPDIA
jgi:hypothetical protein